MSRVQTTNETSVGSYVIKYLQTKAAKAYMKGNNYLTILTD